jgi:hypothetical protein
LIFISRPKPKTLRLSEKISVARNDSSTNENSSILSFAELKRKIRISKSMNGVENDDLSDSGIDKACDDLSTRQSDIEIPNSPRIPPEGIENEDIQHDQLRPHNQKQHSTINILSDAADNECQQTTNSEYIDTSNSINGMNKIIRMNSHPSQFRGSYEGQSNNPFGAQHEHHTSLPFSNNTYAAFKKGNVVRGILCPSLTNSFR